MFVAIGIVVLLVMVFGGFMLAGGAMGPVLAALPLEFMMIGGAAGPRQMLTSWHRRA